MALPTSGLPLNGLVCLNAMFSYSELSIVRTDTYPKLRLLLVNLQFPQYTMIWHTSVGGIKIHM